MNFDDMIDRVNDLVEDYIQDNTQSVTADKLGLDIRAGYTLYIDTDSNVIGVRASNVRLLEYYGGFSYIDESHTECLGDYKFYTCASDRVQDCFDYYNENNETEGDE